MSTNAKLTLSSIDQLANHILEHFCSGTRKLIAIAGPPGAGKSTASITLCDRLPGAAVLQADGFHFDNALLDYLGRRQRKGAPDTFDCAGLKHSLEQVRRGDVDVVVPVFDRDLDLSRGSAAIIAAEARFVIVEGNYLASSERPWVGLRPCFDLLIYLDVPMVELVHRLEQRWVGLGWPRTKVQNWIQSNDLPNVAFVERTKSNLDVVVQWGT